MFLRLLSVPLFQLNHFLLQFFIFLLWRFWIVTVGPGRFVVEAVMSLQLPGLSYGGGEPTTVEVDFLDDANNPIYTLKGEVFVQSAPMQANSVFLPDKLTGKQQFVRHIRIKAGESGMVLKLFDSPTASVPILMLLMKAGFLMSNNEPIDIDVMSGDEHQTIQQAEINWYNRDVAEIQKMKGLHVGKMELHVERTESAPLQPVFKLGVVSNQQSSLLYPETMMMAVNAASNVPQGAPSLPGSASNVVFNLAPQPQQRQFAVPMMAQYPNAPLYQPIY